MPDSPHHGQNRFEQGGRDSDVPAVRSLTLDVEEGVYVAKFNDGDGSPNTAVVSVVAEITGQSVTALQPLHYAVDPDALNQIVRHRSSDSSGKANKILPPPDFRPIQAELVD